MAQSLSIQPSFEGLCPIADAVERIASDSGIEQRGAIYTKRDVVDFILDLVGYTVDQSLTNFRLLEPSFGNGDFMLPTVERLLTAAQREPSGLGLEQLAPAIRGVELHRKTFESTRQALGELMMGQGVSRKDTAALLKIWFIQGDFLLCDFDQDFTHAVGNPPYVRQDMIPDVLMGEYRRRYSMIYDRADLYVPFIEQSLRLLGKEGKLSFICADRWMKNRYGKKLRELISKTYHLATYIDMVGTDAFHSEVTSYPAITVIERRTPGQIGNITRVFARPEINKNALSSLVRELTLPKLKASSIIREIDGIGAGSEPWILEDSDALALVRRLEARFPRLEDAGCNVGIWDVHALQAVMNSGIARLFVSLYSTKIRGGYLRFQAQYLRRIRLPQWNNVSEPVRERLKRCSETNDHHELHGIVASLYGLSADEMALVEREVGQ